MSEIAVQDVSVDGTRITATVDCEGGVDRFLSGEPFFVEYDVDVSAVPEGVLSIPVLAQLCPVAWAAGADVRVPAVDRRFLDSLRDVRTVLREMYPSFVEGSAVVADSTPDARSDVADTTAGALFTGGVDSLATYLRHRDEAPTLINVQGWVVGLDEQEKWSHTRRRIDEYGDRFGTETRYVRSNMLSFLETPMLSAHFSDQHDGGWYSAVGGGVGMLGLCAPLTVARDIGTLYVGATGWEGMPVPSVVDYWEGRGMPWGSHPDIDSRVAWADTEAVHDGFELTRQERIGVIASYIGDGHPDLPIRSCSDSPTGDNCNDCEKCFRTALGLAVEGVDPNEHGFELDASSYAVARERFEDGEWLPDEHHIYYWDDIRRHASADQFPVEGTAAFLSWLDGVDLDAIVEQSDRGRYVRAIARNTPDSAYSVLYPAYKTLEGLVGSARD